MQRLRLKNTEKEKSPGKGRLSTVTFTKKITNFPSNFCVNRLKGIQHSLKKNKSTFNLKIHKIFFNFFFLYLFTFFTQLAYVHHNTWSLKRATFQYTLARQEDLFQDWNYLGWKVWISGKTSSNTRTFVSISSGQWNLMKT